MASLQNFHKRNNQRDLGRSNAEPEFVACRMEDEDDSKEVSANIKQEFCDNYESDDCIIVSSDTDVTLDTFVDVKPDTEDRPVQNLVSELKEELNTLRCEVCGDDYELYCSKCPMLVRILDADLPSKIENRMKQTLPKDLFGIREVSSGCVGVVALRAVPQGVIFGPFQGIVPVTVRNTLRWKINKGKLDCSNSKYLNWMQYVRYSNELLLRNLMPFQYKDELFYQSTRLIKEGEELLVCFDDSNVNDGNYIQLSVIKDKLEDVYACTLCCLGFCSAMFLSKHNTVCQGKKDKDASFKGSTIIQCTFCKIYLPEMEHAKVHSRRCCARNKIHRLSGNVVESRTEKEDQAEGGSEEAVTFVSRRFKCSKCSFDTAYEKLLDKHLLKHDSRWKLVSPKLEKNISKAKRFKCSQCPYETDVKRCLIRHCYIHAAEKPFKCGACGKGYTCRNGLRTHMGTVHPEIALQCTMCKFQSGDRRELQEHVKLAHAHVCATCGYETNVKNRYNQHLLIHTGAKNFQCGHCEKLFSSKSNLKLHLDNVHNAERRYTCGSCPYQTNRKDSFKQHLMIHQEDDTRFRCEICNLGFKLQWQLRHHDERRHMSGEQKYECSVCFVEFPRRSALVKHAQLAHADNAEKFLCSVCGYATDRKKDLVQHHASVHRKVKKPFECALCDVGFGSAASFKKHNMRKHPNGVKVAGSSAAEGAAPRIKEEMMD